ncbi:hypothetical protein [Chitinimonas sp.]|uniref:hypothetical protein n=1 Tax=Chitinimonas sp. TaxID=1934313 RepID=UPI002F953082
MDVSAGKAAKGRAFDHGTTCQGVPDKRQYPYRYRHTHLLSPGNTPPALLAIGDKTSKR